MNSEGVPGSEIGKEVVGGIESVARFLRGIGDRLDVISEGLKAENPNSEGAAGLLDDMFNGLYDASRDAEDLANKARELAAVAADPPAKRGHLRPVRPQEARQRDAT